MNAWPAQVRNVEGNQIGRDNNMNAPIRGNPQLNHVMTGYGRIPLHLQQGVRPRPYPAVPMRPEIKHDNDMTLEEAVNGNWCPRNNNLPQMVGNSLLRQELSGQITNEQAGGLTGHPRSTSAMGSEACE